MCVCGREIMMLSKCCSIAKIGTFSVAAIGVTLVLIIWAASTGIAQAQIKEVINPVKLVPQSAGGNLKVEKDNQCRKGKHDGCLLFERDTLVRIVFHLPGSKNQVKYCPEAKNVITKIEVTATAAKGSATDDKGDFNGSASLPAWLKENAFPEIDLETGVIYAAESWKTARTQEWITNLNDHLSPSNVPDIIHSFWYKITVTACDDTGTTWVSDPRGDNEGKH